MNSETSDMTQSQRQSLRKQYSFYFGKLKSLWEYDPDEDLTDEELDRYEEKYDYYSDMAELKNFQLEHDIMITSEQEKKCKEWLLDGLPFKFDFDVGIEDFVPIDKNYGCCYLDYLLTDNEKFKIRVEKYRISYLCCIHEGDDEYDDLIKQSSILSMKEFLLDHTFNDVEINECIEWINGGHGFKSNPWYITDKHGYPANYLEAEMTVYGDEILDELYEKTSETISKLTDAVKADMKRDKRKWIDDDADALDMLLRSTITAMDVKKACEENDDIDEEGFMDIYLQKLSYQLETLKKAYRDKYKEFTGRLEVIIDDGLDESSPADEDKGYDMEMDDIQF